MNDMDGLPKASSFALERLSSNVVPPPCCPKLSVIPQSNIAGRTFDRESKNTKAQAIAQPLEFFYRDANLGLIKTTAAAMFCGC